MIDYLKSLAQQIKLFEIPFNENLILNLLKIEKRWPFRYSFNQPSVEIINNFGNNNFNIELFRNNGYLNYDIWLKYYNLGYSTVISNILDLTPELRKLNDFLKEQVGSEQNANLYLSKSNSNKKPSFPTHFHSYDVIVKQLYGSAHWEIDNKQIILNKDEVLIIPKGTNHRVYKVTEPKLSLTINLE